MKKLGWFVLLYLASFATVALVALALRAIIRG